MGGPRSGRKNKRGHGHGHAGDAGRGAEHVPVSAMAGIAIGPRIAYNVGGIRVVDAGTASSVGQQPAQHAQPAQPAQLAQPAQPARKSSPSSTANRSSWCTQCWAHPGDGCLGGEDHRVLPYVTAQHEARAAVHDAYRALKHSQARLDAILGAVEPLFLTAEIEYTEIADDRVLDGAELTIKLAPIDGGLTDDEKSSFTAAMEAGELECYLDELWAEDGVVVIKGRLNDSCGVMKKLPLCVAGQQLHAGYILYLPNEKTFNYHVFGKAVLATDDHVRREARVLGQVTEGLDELSARHFYPIECLHLLPYVPPRSDDPVPTKLYDVTFVDQKVQD